MRNQRGLAVNAFKLILFLFFLVSCTQSSNSGKKNVVTTTSNNNTNPPGPYYPCTPYPSCLYGTGTGSGSGTGGGGTGDYPYGDGYPPDSISMGESYGNGNEPGIADAGQTVNYYKLNNPPIVVHGAGTGTVVWSSESDLPSGIDPYILQTDSRLNVRVIPRVQSYGVDSRGNNCAYDAMAYTKLNVGVRVRKQGTGSGDYYQFQNIRVNGASKVHEFSVPASSNPLVIDILNVEWDYECIYYALDGYHNYPYSCPFANVWQYDCVSFDLQFSTDDTKDIPGTRTYQ